MSTVDVVTDPVLEAQVTQVLHIGLASPRAATTITRRAVKAVAVRGSKLLMLRSGSGGDFKFPGGGTNDSETDQQALARELSEECGTDLIRAGEALLELVETRPDSTREGVDFEMVSVYFPCSVSPRRRGQDLDVYERALDLTPEWVTLDRAIATNEKVLESGSAARWVERETLVLRWLRDTGVR